ncbi:chloride intracellular channel 6-like protein [Anopheles darlingi]|uniref:Chloride intracellular channel 6-like protein n=1 Tax=Anopheles darlingi TaxID=43151 RepID=W5JPN6_ANODA|nr:chloride intracellular channel 6-like protein [Anopheles darlingi]
MDLYLLAELKTISLKTRPIGGVRGDASFPAIIRQEAANNVRGSDFARRPDHMISRSRWQTPSRVVLQKSKRQQHQETTLHTPPKYAATEPTPLHEAGFRIVRLCFTGQESVVTTVCMQKPPPDFRTNFEATHPPILIDNGLAILENDKIERHIMKSVPGGYNLFVQDKEVATLIENLYSKLKLMLVKKDESKNNALLVHLKKINDHLATRGTRFLTGDTMCCFDCELMPRLQHIRVAGKYFVDFDIPKHLTALWRYMYHMYQLDAFTQSCPADQDIINHYKLQQAKGDIKMLKMKKHEELETPTFTTSIPVDLNDQ